MLRVVIIEDEIKQVEALNYLLLNDAKIKTEVIGNADSSQTAIQLINDLQPDIVFMDIQLKAGNAFDVLKNVKFHDFSLIFTTAYQEHALLAFKYSAIDYLLKPLDLEELNRALERAALISKRITTKSQIDQLEHNLEKVPELITLPTQEGIHVIELRSLVRCETSGSYTTFHLENGKKIMMSRSLKSFDDLLTPPRFFRIHQSHTINLSFIKSYTRNGTVTLKDETILQVAQRKKELFLKTISGINEI